jgi:hypothetical protein
MNKNGSVCFSSTFLSFGLCKLEIYKIVILQLSESSRFLSTLTTQNPKFQDFVTNFRSGQAAQPALIKDAIQYNLHLQMLSRHTFRQIHEAHYLAQLISLVLYRLGFPNTTKPSN